MVRKRVLVYSHDTYGLGHLRRSLLIADLMTRMPSRPRVLVATGSPRAQAFRVPQGCDTLKLPAILKQSDGSYGARTLGIPVSELVGLRSSILVGALRAFAPDMILVDHSPLGVCGELLPVFEALDCLPRRPHVVLGLRDVIDDAEVVRRAWSRSGVFEILDEIYDDILVYGDPRVETTASELALEVRYPGRVHHVGYLGRSFSSGGAERDPRVLVTGGGGGDGQALFTAVAGWLARRRKPLGFRCELVTGPFLSRRRFQRIEGLLAGAGGEVVLEEFVDDLGERLQGAAAAVAMAGYNTAVELLAAGIPALLVPRTSPRMEQAIRAERLSRATGMRVARAAELDDGVLERFLADALSGAATPKVTLDLGGLSRSARILAARLEGRASAIEGEALHARS